MRADRLVSIMLLLQARQRMTAGELAEQLEVSERTIHRDMDALSIAGIPVMSERGKNGGWSLVEGYQTRLNGLNPDEIQALFMGQPAHILADLGLQDASQAALLKLYAALPAIRRHEAESVRNRIHIDSAGWHPRAQQTNIDLPILQQAIWQEHALAITYERGNGEITKRIVEPLGLVAKGSIWYLVAHIDDEMRNYRVSRIHQATITEQRFTRPPDFDLSSYWAQSTSEFVATLPRYIAQVRVDSAILPRMHYTERFAKIQEVGTVDENNWCEVVIRFDTEDEACRYILGFGPQMEVLEPQDLRAKVIDLAQKTLEFYRGRAMLPHRRV